MGVEFSLVASSRSKRFLGVGILSSLICAAVFFFSYDFEPEFSPVIQEVVVSKRAQQLHEDSVVIDLHVDSLLWPRDLTRENIGGQVDFPRMRRGGLDGAAFTIVTEFFGLSGLKALHDGWPLPTWRSPWERLNYQLDKMKTWAQSGEIQLRKPTLFPGTETTFFAFHGIEGAHALEEKLHRLDDLAKRNVVFVSPVHLTDNGYGGSLAGSGRGLTDLGRKLIIEMNKVGLLLDLAHVSMATFNEAIALTEFPPLVSHTGVKGVHDSSRNLSDAQIQAIASRGGLVGVMFAPPALKNRSLLEVVLHIEHVILVGGEDTVAIGSDFDGYVKTPIDVSNLPVLTEMMLRRGFTENRIRKVLGGNVLRVLTQAHMRTKSDL